MKSRTKYKHYLFLSCSGHLIVFVILNFKVILPHQDKLIKTRYGYIRKHGTNAWSRDTKSWPQDSNGRVPKLKGMLSSNGTIRIHNYNGTSIKIKQTHWQHKIRQKVRSDIRCFDRIRILCSIILAPVVMF